MKRLVVLFSTLFFILACTQKSKHESQNEHLKTSHPIQKKTVSKIEQNIIDQGLVKIDSSIAVEMKYSTEDNFMKKDVYGDFDVAYLQPQTAKMLKNAQEILQKDHPNYSLLVYDATRPLSIQWVLWNTLEVKPGEIKTDFVADPKKGSIHNYGCAVDLTVLNTETKQPLDMGTPYDFFGELAYPKHERRLLAEGKLRPEQLDNRMVLRNAMKKAGFLPIESEWWHFNSVSRERAKKWYKIVE